MNTVFRPSSFQILPPVVKNLLIINILVFVAELTFDGIRAGGDLEPITGHFTNLFALHAIESSLFRPWQIITHMFMHGSLFHIFFNMFALYMFGSILENVWTPGRFFIFYMVCGIGAACMHLGFLAWENHHMLADFNTFKAYPNYNNFSHFVNKYNLREVEGLKYDPIKILEVWKTDPSNPALPDAAFSNMSDFVRSPESGLNNATLGASGAIFGCLAAFGYLFPNTSLYIMFIPIPIKAKWALLGYTAFEIIMAIRNSAGDNVAHFAHLGGALVGFLLVFFWNKTNKKTFY